LPYGFPYSHAGAVEGRCADVEPIDLAQVQHSGEQEIGVRAKYFIGGLLALIVRRLQGAL